MGLGATQEGGIGGVGCNTGRGDWWGWMPQSRLRFFHVSKIFDFTYPSLLQACSWSRFRFLVLARLEGLSRLFRSESPVTGVAGQEAKGELARSARTVVQTKQSSRMACISP